MIQTIYFMQTEKFAVGDMQIKMAINLLVVAIEVGVKREKSLCHCC